MFFDDDSTINIEKYAEISRFPEIDSSFITEEEYYKYLVAEYEEGYDEEYIYHDRDMDYDYDYENDCEYDSDEEIYGSYDNDDYDE